MQKQSSFEFIRAMDDELKGTIEGWPPSTWFHRRYYATAEEGLEAARRVVRYLGTVYLVEFPVDKGFEEYWPHPTYWFPSTDKPFYGQVIGAFYYGKPNYYVITALMTVFEKGEDPEEVKRKNEEAMIEFRRQQLSS